MMVVCYCCKEIIKEEKEFYLTSVQPVEIVEEQICYKTSPWSFNETCFCSLGCIIVELAKRTRQ